MNSQPRTADLGGGIAPSAIHPARPFFFRKPVKYSPRSTFGRVRKAKRWVWTAWLAVLGLIFVGCGVQAPPRPPRIENPARIKDLGVAQIGRSLRITFTMPTLATDGEQLTKPVQIDIYRAISPAGQKPAQPDASGAPWQSFLPRELHTYVHAGQFDYPMEISTEEFRRRQGSTFSFVVIAFTRGFMGHPRKSPLSNIARATLLDVTRPVTGFSVKTTRTALLLTWQKPVETLTGKAPTDLSRYRVYQSATGKPDSFRLLGKTTSTHFEDKQFQFGQQYYFRITAVTAVDGTVAESAPSATVGIKPRDIFPPSAPTGLTAVNAAGAVDLVWTAKPERDLAGYNVYRSTDGKPFERINKRLVPTPIFHDTSVAPDHHYQYAVTAVNLAGNESARSKPASITTPPSGRH